MPGILDPTDLTYNGEEIRQLNEAVFEATYNNPALNQFHTIDEGIVAKKQIALAGLIGMVGVASDGCDPTADDNQIPFSEKFWDPKDIQVRLEQCWTDLLPSFIRWGMDNGVKKPNLDGIEFMNFAEDRLSFSISEAILRIAWFNDTAAAHYNDSPAGQVTNTTALKYYNILDGFWKQLFAIGTADADRVDTISVNAGASYAAQALADGDSLTILENLVYNADSRLADHPDKVIIVTKSIANNYAKYLRSQGVDESFKRIEGGYSILEFEGITVIPFDFWDRKIKADFNNGTVWYLPHRAIMTTPDNLRVGVETEGALSEIDVFYDKKSKKNYMDALFSMDVKVIEDHMVQLAY